jgi:isocitrate dehydrogenase
MCHRSKVGAWYDISKQNNDASILSYEVLLPIMGIIEVQQLIDSAIRTGKKIPIQDQQLLPP